MADNATTPYGTVATDKIGGVDYQRVKISHGVDGSATDTSGTNPLPVSFYGPTVDAFMRLRVANPETIFDSKQLFDAQPFFWDESLESGGGISSAHSTARASTIITSTLNTAGTFTRQTFQRFNYQPGKSQLVMMTGILDPSGGGTGVTRRIGAFDDDNGVFFEDAEGTVRVVVRSSVSGSPVDTAVAQASWDDPLDGTGASGVTVDWTKTQIFGVDFEWLGVGSVRFFMVFAGRVHIVHTVNYANSGSAVYMSTPNLPLRYQMVTANPSAASTLECICSTVISEGGRTDNGILRYKSTAGTHVDADAIDTLYGIVGIRLKTTHADATVDVESVSIVCETNDDFEWQLVWNPTVAGPPTWGAETNSAVETFTGATANTISGGTVITGGFGDASAALNVAITNALRLGIAIDGTTQDSIVLCARPLSANANIQGSIGWRERQ